jgi:hypothetical protein
MELGATPPLAEPLARFRSEWSKATEARLRGRLAGATRLLERV